MEEAEWLASADPAAMIAWLTAQRRGEVPRGDPGNKAVSDRKLRLWLAACCRAAWGSLTDERSRRAVEVAEYYADGQAADPERAEALQAALRAARPMPAGPAQVAAATAAHCCQRPIGPMSTLRDQERDLPGLTRADQSALLRDLVGNPWRPALRSSHPADEEGGVWQRQDDGMERQVLTPSALTPTVLSLARAAYQQRLPDGFLDPSQLAVLSDALEEAGCGGERCAKCSGGVVMMSVWDNPGPVRRVVPTDCALCLGSGVLPHPLLAHLRSPVPHARGCFCLDLLLGRE